MTLKQVWGGMTGHQRTWAVMAALAVFALGAYVTNGLLLLLGLGALLVAVAYMAVWSIVSGLDEKPW